MDIGKNYFKKAFSKLKIKQKSNGCSIEISLERMGKRLDIAQDALDAQAWSDIKDYMPMQTEALINATDTLNKSVRGEVYLYPPEHDYGHYLYEGQLYVDPDTGSPWAKYGAEKVPANPYRPLFFERESAEAHWDEAAYRDHKKDWVKVAKNAMKG